MAGIEWIQPTTTTIIAIITTITITIAIATTGIMSRAHVSCARMQSRYRESRNKFAIRRSGYLSAVRTVEILLQVKYREVALVGAVKGMQMLMYISVEA